MASDAPPLPKLAIAGLVIWGAGLMASQTGDPPADPVERRAYLITIGVITFAGFLMAVIGGIRWWRAKKRP